MKKLRVAQILEDEQNARIFNINKTMINGSALYFAIKRQGQGNSDLLASIINGLNKMETHIMESKHGYLLSADVCEFILSFITGDIKKYLYRDD